MNLETHRTGIPGFVELRPRVHADARGTFVKVFHRRTFESLGLPTEWPEEYWSRSDAGVVRGLHFQAPPHDHHKLVYCVAGAVLDAAVDLRKGSATFGDHATVWLSSEKANAVVLAPGLAHGFCVTDAPAVLVYRVTTAYDADHDAGVRWDSVGIPWPVEEPVVSDRDAALPALADFDSPFRWSGRDSEGPLLGEGRR